ASAKELDYKRIHVSTAEEQMVRAHTRAESRTPRNRARARALLLAMSLALCAPAIAASQQFRGALVGTVIDPAGALVPEARVTLTGIATNTTLATRTNDNGFYVIEYIPPGQYRLRVEASGFQTLTLEPIEVRVGDRLTLHLRLGIGPFKSDVMVAGDT